MKTVFFVSFVLFDAFCVLQAVLQYMCKHESALNLFYFLVDSHDKPNRQKTAVQLARAFRIEEWGTQPFFRGKALGRTKNTYICIAAAASCFLKLLLQTQGFFFFSFIFDFMAFDSVCMLAFTAIHDLSLFLGHSLCVFAACLNSCVTDQLQEEQRGAGQGRWS